MQGLNSTGSRPDSTYFYEYGDESSNSVEEWNLLTE